ncbi:MAG: hypothetical protein M3Y08_12615 [Fibrobacterota bacterium]|nr:hypothetical protein [Fibrobacterota bacterium]
MNTSGNRNSQAGGGMLSVVAVLGMVLLLVQGTMYHRAKSSARFLGSEKTKVLAQQMAEAGVEENIADIGARTLRLRSGLIDTVTYDNKALEGGFYTSTLTTVSIGAAADTIDLVSKGSVGKATQTVRARLKLKKYLDTTLTPIMFVEPDTTYSYVTVTVPETTTTTVVLDPSSMPDVDNTPAYTACMSSGGKKCDVCHLPGGDLSKAHVINISKSAIKTHVNHHGDYVTTDGTCDLYDPVTSDVITMSTHVDTVVTVTDMTTYDTTLVIDTLVKVQILSWK